MSVKVVKFEDGREPQIGDTVVIDGQIYYYSGKRRFSTETIPASATSYDSCESAVLSTGGTLESPSYPVQDYCADHTMDVELDRMYINPYDEISVGDKVFFNGRGFVKTGNKGTATHVLTAMPTVVDYNAKCSGLLDCSVLQGAYVFNNTPLTWFARNSDFAIGGFTTPEQGQAWADALNTPMFGQPGYIQWLNINGEIIKIQDFKSWGISYNHGSYGANQWKHLPGTFLRCTSSDSSFPGMRGSREYYYIGNHSTPVYSHSHGTTVQLANCDTPGDSAPG